MKQKQNECSILPSDSFTFSLVCLGILLIQVICERENWCRHWQPHFQSIPLFYQLATNTIVQFISQCHTTFRSHSSLASFPINSSDNCIMASVTFLNQYNKLSIQKKNQIKMDNSSEDFIICVHVNCYKTNCLKFDFQLMC